MDEIELSGRPRRLPLSLTRQAAERLTLPAGFGNQLTFTNTNTGSMIALRANGSVSQTVINADGSQTVTLGGHNVLILFPSDVPAGPSTTLYVGRVVYTVDINQVFTLVSTSGSARDICAELS